MSQCFFFCSASLPHTSLTNCFNFLTTRQARPIHTVHWVSGGDKEVLLIKPFKEKSQKQSAALLIFEKLLQYSLKKIKNL